MGSSNVIPFPDWLNCSVGKLVVLCTERYKEISQSGVIRSAALHSACQKVCSQEIFRSFHKEITKISVDFHTNAAIPNLEELLG